MRKLKEVLRLHSLGLSQHQIARSCSISQSTVHEYLSAAQAAGVKWPAPEHWDDQQIELGRPGISVDSGLGESDEGEVPCPQETNPILGPRREPGGRLSRLQNRRPPPAAVGQRGARCPSFWSCCVARTWRPRL